jgi:hypothetical protein
MVNAIEFDSMNRFTTFASATVEMREQRTVAGRFAGAA